LKCFEAVHEHLQIQEFLRERTLENLAFNNVYVLESFLKGESSEYLKLSNGIKNKLRMHGLIERKWVEHGWTYKPTDLWKKIIDENES
jgi:hypothetical protein